jgi:hypothetical protein
MSSHHRKHSSSSSKSDKHRSSSKDSGGVVPSRDSHASETDTNVRLTFENLKATIDMMPENSLDKSSVARMVKTIYHWMMIDVNSQISLPSGAGNTGILKMWPHGAIVDSRRGTGTVARKSTSKGLDELDEDAASIVSGSVVSGTLDDDRGYMSRGGVTRERAGSTSHAPEINFASLTTGQGQGWTGPPLQGYQQHTPPVAGGPPQYVSQWTGASPSRPVWQGSQWGNDMPGIVEKPEKEDVPLPIRTGAPARFSIINSGGIVPQPTRVVDSPAPMEAVPVVKRKVVKRVKATGTRRADADLDDGGTPVTFAQY